MDNLLLAWSNKVSLEFAEKLIKICAQIGVNPNFLMACIAFETGRAFSPSVLNKHSGAVGLIQFMKPTALHLDTTPDKLKSMTALEQLDYVLKYFTPYTGRLHSLEDTYMAILYPKAIGKPNDYILFNRDDYTCPKQYIQNKGLDFNQDGLIIKSEAASRPREELSEGMKNNNFDYDKYLSATPIGVEMIRKGIWA